MTYTAENLSKLNIGDGDGLPKTCQNMSSRRRRPAENLVKPSVFTLANSTACRVKVSTYRRIAHPVLRENLRKPTFYAAGYEVRSSYFPISRARSISAA